VANVLNEAKELSRQALILLNPRLTWNSCATGKNKISSQLNAGLGALANSAM